MFSSIGASDSSGSEFNYSWKDTILDDIVHPLSDEQVSLGEISSPISAQLLKFCDPEMFPTEPLTNSEVGSSSNWSYDENSSYTTNLSTTHQDAMYNVYNDTNSSNLSIIFNPKDDHLENDISVSINFSPSKQQDHFVFSSLQQQQPQLSLTNFAALENDRFVLDDLLGNTNNMMPPYFHENYLPSLPSSSCSFLDLNMTQYFPGDNGGLYCPNSMQRLLTTGDLQKQKEKASIENQHGGGTCASLVSEITSSLDESAFKVGKLSVEERKEKIHRYMKKRNQRNFNKKIKYACRKTLADSRPRVRGRFAKNDEFGEFNYRATGNIQDEDDNETMVRLKEEDGMLDSSDIFSHISGVNSFKCNYSIQSWY